MQKQKTIILKTSKKIQAVLPTMLLMILLLSFIAVTNAANQPTTGGNGTPLRTLTTHTFMSISPNPAGINQAVTLYIFSNLDTPTVANTPYYGWNFTVTVTDPDGQKSTLTPPMSQPNGYTSMAFIPTKLGTYQFQAFFAQLNLTFTDPGAGGFIPGLYTFTASESTVKNLTVTTTEVLPRPNVPLPEGYWESPIYSTNFEWYTLKSNWLGGIGGNAPTSTTGPLSSHILWTKPLAYGGLSGGTVSVDETNVGSPILYDQTGLNYFTGLLYQNKLTQFIINGYYIYNIQPQLNAGVRCLNLRTGALVWENLTMPNISCGQVTTLNMGLGSGSLAYLWYASGSNWYQIDAFTGKLITVYTGAQSFTPIQGPNGEILVYTLNPANHWLTLWNSTWAIQATGGSDSGASTLNPQAESYQPYTTMVRPWNNGIQWNETIPTTYTSIPGNNSLPSFSSGQLDYRDGVLVAVGSFYTNTTNPIWAEVGYSTEHMPITASNPNGGQLWYVNRTNIGWGQGGPSNPGLYIFSGATFGSGVYGLFERETLQWHIINIKTGREQAVTPPLNTLPGVSDWAYYDWHANIDKGIMYTAGYSGKVCAFNTTTGACMWVFDVGDTGIDNPFGTLPTYGGVTITNGVVYYGPIQHTPQTPMYRGYKLFAINATTGDKIWEIPAFFASIAQADGILTGYDGYDNKLYAIGKGPSATTVTAPQTETALGTNVLITGTITDQSPGQTCLGCPAAGTPAIADCYMSDWMAYLYKQQPKPNEATGVEVTVSIVDPNDNYYVIGKATSDANGQYSLAFKPDVPGLYTVTATFSGTDSYYNSAAQTHLLVGEDTNPTPTTNNLAGLVTTQDLMIYAIGTAIASVLAIAIVGILILRKKQ
ncbi:hypothetical protein [Candidatus Bathycorpusculum sp.]|uniref:hypothetical protein n=1 Tax=Candidatus Bathycorpusculum sp. TaxID=2994959 RepID=UPI00282C7E0B|nr:hypothetical protein [Candidatus Termitimicrobium sp.]MCL2685336.1 hypothetical protein [Candidatus Termitimicrobium sp.]